MRSEIREAAEIRDTRPPEGEGEGAVRRSRPGRPRVWADAQARNHAAGQRRTARLQLLQELELALFNARWDEPAVQRLVDQGDELEVLQGLIDYFRRHRRSASRVSGAGE